MREYNRTSEKQTTYNDIQNTDSVSFLNALKKETKDDNNLIYTANGAVVYKSIGNDLVDFFNSTSSLRGASTEEIKDAFEKAYIENPLLASKLAFQTGTIRGGKGERHIFNECMDWLGENHPFILNEMLPLIPEYTRWDYLTRQINNPDEKIANEALKIVLKQLKEDQKKLAEDKPISLLAKWLPSVVRKENKTKNGEKIPLTEKKQNDRRIVLAIQRALKLNNTEYRRMITPLRDKLNLMEKYLSEGKLNEVDLSTFTTHNWLRYGNTIAKKAPENLNNYLTAVEKGEAKLNATVLYPYEIEYRYKNIKRNEINPLYEIMWKMQPKYEGTKKILPIVDVSGSMTWEKLHNSNAEPLDVAISLGIYTSERLSGEFRDKFITFSSNPNFVDLSNCDSLQAKIQKTSSANVGGSTNIEKTFDLILNTAINNNLSQDELPDYLLIMSDMEFDVASNCNWLNDSYTYNKTLFNTIKEKYNAAGYEIPTLVFWNLNVNRTVVPEIDNERGLVLLSGFDINTLEMVMQGKFEKEAVNEITGEKEKVVLSPEEQLNVILSNKLYDSVEESFIKGHTMERNIETWIKGNSEKYINKEITSKKNIESNMKSKLKHFDYDER